MATCGHAVVLALLERTRHQRGVDEVSKGFIWDMLDRLHAKSMIGDPKHKHAAVVLTHAGVADAAASFRQVFGPRHAATSTDRVMIFALLQHLGKYSALYAPTATSGDCCRPLS